MNAEKTLIFSVVASIALIALCSAAFATNADTAINVSLSITSSAKLSLGATNLTFTAQDPALQPSIPAAENPVSVVAKIRSKGSPTLTVLAQDDLHSGQDIIPVTAISWTADAAPYIAGTMSKSSAQPAALFPAGSGVFQSSFEFSLINNEGYLPGTYATVINYTLTAP